MVCSVGRGLDPPVRQGDAELTLHIALWRQTFYQSHGQTSTLIETYIGVLALRLLEVRLGVVIRHGVLVRVRLGSLLSFIALGETDSEEAGEQKNLDM